MNFKERNNGKEEKICQPRSKCNDSKKKEIKTKKQI